MTVLNVLHFPDPRLRDKAAPISTVDDRIRRLADDMIETMYACNGIGLAAIQVGVRERIMVIDVSDEGDQPLVFINPEMLSGDGEAQVEEGCLSVPGYYEPIQRLGKVRVRALDREGEPFEMDAEGLFAICIQHEIDHLNGKLFVDYLSDLKRNRIRKKLEKSQRQAASDTESAPARGRGSPVI